MVGTFALANLLGCGRLAGLDDYATGRGKDDCDRCAESACRAQSEQCAEVPECSRLVGCIAACEPNDGPCIAECGQALAAKPSEFGALNACLEENCFRSCPSCIRQHALASGAQCAACAEIDRGEGGNCDLVQRCMENADCRGYRACLSAECNAFAPDPGCRLGCGSRFPEGARLMYLNSGSRLTLACAEPCGLGRQWGCLPISWPPRLGDTARVTLRAQLFFIPPAPATIAQAAACMVGDPFCDLRVANGQGNAEGIVTFELRTSENPLFGFYYEVKPQDLDPVIFAPTQPLIGDITFWVPVFGAFLQALEQGARDRGIPFDPELGRIVVLIADCIGGVPPGELTISATPPGSEPFYGIIPGNVEGGGLGYVVNMPDTTNTTTIEVWLEGEEDPVAQARVPVRRGTTTVVTFHYPQWP